jgi:hypothetical protein
MNTQIIKFMRSEIFAVAPHPEDMVHAVCNSCQKSVTKIKEYVKVIPWPLAGGFMVQCPCDNSFAIKMERGIWIKVPRKQRGLCA